MNETFWTDLRMGGARRRTGRRERKAIARRDYVAAQWYMAQSLYRYGRRVLQAADLVCPRFAIN